MPFRPSHRQLQYFLAVAERGHFAEAAKECCVSQPTLSVQLKLLEEQLGSKLIERGGDAARPTPVGEQIMPLVRSVFQALDEIVEVAGAGAGNLGGLVRLGVAPTFGPYFLPHLLPRLHAQFPALEIYIREDRPSELEAGLAAGTIDCVLTPLPLHGERLEHISLCREQIYLGVPAEHPIATASPVTLNMLAGEQLLTLGRGHRLYGQVQQLCEKSGATLREDYEGTSLDAIRQMVSIGMGLSLFPAAYVASEFGRDTVVQLLQIEDAPMDRTICLAWRRQSVRENHYRVLAKEAVAVLSALEIAGVRASPSTS